jgi:hypothetical protein
MSTSATIRSEDENLRPDASAETLNKARRGLEAELAACRIRARTARLHPRIASILAASPLTRPMLEAGLSCREREGREENLRIKIADKFSLSRGALAAGEYGDPRDMALEAIPDA